MLENSEGGNMPPFAVLQYLIKADATAVIPVGTLLSLPGNALSDGWLATDGSDISRTTYSDLFTNIGTTYGAGDGSTTFMLPDLQGRVALGAGQGTTTQNRLL